MPLPASPPEAAVPAVARRSALLAARGVLLVVRPPAPLPKAAPGQPGNQSDYVGDEPDIFVAVQADGRVVAFCGHVDLGTGIRTALAQMVADELDVAFEAVQMVLGHTVSAPNQGPTVASATIQITSVPLRRAAAQARAWLAERAAARLAPQAGQRVEAAEGVFRLLAQDGTPTGAQVAYGDLVAGEHVRLEITNDFPTKPQQAWRVAGRAVGRVDIPAKVTGQLTYVHDVRLPGMLHGRVVYPPYAGMDNGPSVGRCLIDVDRDSIAHIPGIVAVVTVGDFVGIVAEREEHAERAARTLKVHWRTPQGVPDLRDPERALREAPARRRPLHEVGDVDRARARAARVLRRSYYWPYQLHGSIGPSCAVARLQEGRLEVWSGTQNPHMLRTDLARLMDMDEGLVEIIRMEAAGCYGRNCADDVCGDAALLARAVGRPVRVQLTRQQEHLWEPKGAGQLVEVVGSQDADGAPLSYELVSRYPANDAPLLGLLLTGRMSAEPRGLELGDRTSVPLYAYPHQRIACDDIPALARASWFRGVSALPNSFAHDCFVDELAEHAGADPLDYRLAHLPDLRARELLASVAERAGWRRRPPGSRGRPDPDGWLRGHGIAYARYVHSKFPGFGAAWSAWALALRVDPQTGQVHIERVVVGQDAGFMVNPDGVRHQVHGNIVQVVSRTLLEEVRFDAHGAAARDWGGYPLITFPELPRIELVLMERPEEPPLGSGESASVPGPAAIANALYDATGCRFQRAPFTPERVRASLLAGHPHESA
jgi:nicotinate dehydrogenase subunit B